MEPIKLKHLLPKHIQEQSIELDTYRKKYPVEYKIAENLNKSRPALLSVKPNSALVVKSILSIKNIKQYQIVDKILNKITSGTNILDCVIGEDFRNPTFSWNQEVTSGENIISYSQPLRQFELVVNHLNNIGVKRGMEKINNHLTRMRKWTENNRLDVHEEAESAALLVSFIPGVGLYVASGIMLIDAARYWTEGNWYQAGMSTIWAALPFIGPISRLISKIPGVKPGITLTAEFFARIGQKIASKNWKALNPLEIKIIKKLVEKSNYVKTEYNKYLQGLAKKAPPKIKNIGKKGAKVIKTIAKGGVDLSKLGGRMLAGGIKSFGPVMAAQYMWNDMYYRLGLDKGEYERGVEYSLSSSPDLYPTPGTNVYK